MNISSSCRTRKAQTEVDLLTPLKNPRINVRPALVGEIDELYDLIGQNLSLTVAAPSVMRLAMSINRNNIIAFLRRGQLVGFHAMLMLTAAGLEALLIGEFRPLDPDVRHLSPRLEPPAAIYQWLTIAPGMAVEGIVHVSQFLQRPFYRHANLYSRSITVPGARIAVGVGFHPLPNLPMPGLHRYVRRANQSVEAPAQINFDIAA